MDPEEYNMYPKDTVLAEKTQNTETCFKIHCK